MNFAYTILYVRDVPASVSFYEKAFGLSRRFAGPENNYAEMETGGTALAFVAADFVRPGLPGGFTPNDPAQPPAGIEIAFTTPDVPAAYQRAVQAGAHALAGPAAKPWGQVVAYVRDPDGVLIELATPMG
jgi:lactoylglutathione lyase